MTRNAMKLLNIRLYLLFIFAIFIGIIHAQISSVYKLYREARNCVETNDFKNAFKFFNEYIDSTEHTNSQNTRLLGESYYNIGHFFICGHYVECNVDSAISYLNRAAFTYKYAEAARMLHTIYHYDNYGRVDKKKSFDFLKMAADLGEFKSNLELGEVYLTHETRVFSDTIIFNPESGYHTHALLRTTNKKTFPFVEIDIALGYYYYERGFNFHYSIHNDKYLLNDIDFIRAYMDGIIFQKNFSISWEYLKDYLVSSNFIADSQLTPILGEIYWRIQMSYRFGLGTRVNIEKADQYLLLSAKCGYNRAIEALSISF